MKQSATQMIAVLLFSSCSSTNTFNFVSTKINTAINTKYSTIFNTTVIGLTLVSFKLVTIVSTIIPMISSITAAPRIVVPTFPFSLPISRSVSTVILTDVAVSTTPTNTAFNTSS